MDQILASVRNNATVGGWDPIRLPSDSDEFSVTVEYLGLFLCFENHILAVFPLIVI